MSIDEDKALKEWKKYHKAIKEFKLDENKDHNHQGYIDFMYDGFFSGFYAARDLFKKDQTNE